MRGKRQRIAGFDRDAGGFRPDQVPTDVDPLIAPFAPLLGGPPGRYARWNPTRWHVVAAILSMVTALTMTLGVFQKSYCLRQGWGVPEVFWRACYVDMPYVFTNTQLATGGAPYPRGDGSALSQPLGTGVMLWLTSLLVPEGDELTRQQVYVGIWAVLLTAAAIALVVVTVRTMRHRPWVALHIAVSPLLVTVALVSPDLLGVLLASVALLAWSRGKPSAAGIVFGLAILTRTYPVLLLLVVGMLAWRAGRIRTWVRTATAALLTCAGLLLIAGWASGWSVLRVYEAWLNTGPDYGSHRYLLSTAGVEVPVWLVTLLAVLGWVIALVAGAVLTLLAPARPHVAQVAIVVLVIVIGTGKSIPVQTTLWLLPLVALAGMRWRDHLTWAACEVTYFVGVWLYLGGMSDPAKGMPLGWFAVFTGIRLLGLGYLLVVTWRAAMNPGRQELPDTDDVAGPLTGAPDRVVVTIT